uniref:DUF8077 domain-containing protein n=1 Tax=Plectus sambesii TaxID=2011161 RepID=A0A914VP44_9BILA
MSSAYGDPSQQELALAEFTMGVRAAFCSDSPVSDIIEPFRTVIAHFVSDFCRNAAACLLKKSALFTPDHIVFLDGYPKREFGVVNARFIVVMPHSVVPMARYGKPLLTKTVLSDIVKKHVSDIAEILGWNILSFEKMPKFDPVTEFMNQALIPIGIIIGLFMLFLAFWSSTLSSSSYGGEGWSVSGQSGGKNAAAKRTQEFIERQMSMQWPETGGVDSGGQMGYENGDAVVLNVSTLSLPGNLQERRVSFSKQRQASGSQSQESVDLGIIPGIVITPDSGGPSSTSLLSPSPASQRRLSHSRRMSSIEDMASKRARQSKSFFGAMGSSDQKKWKAGSMALRGFGKKRSGE